MSARSILLAGLLASLAVACGGGPERIPAEPPPPTAATDAPAAPELQFLDEDCVVQARTIRVVLPRVLRAECRTESLTGGWTGDTYRGRGRVDVRIRKLRLLAESMEIVVTGGPVSNLRVSAEGDARISTPTLERLDDPAELIIVSPTKVLIE